MDISKFDFTKFSKEKWQEILTEIEGDYNYVDVITPNFKLKNGELIPMIKVEYIYETEVNGDEEYFLNFTAFDVKIEEEVFEIPTRIWRKIMYKEFGKKYYDALNSYLKRIKEEKIQKADEEYFKSIEYLNNL